MYSPAPQKPYFPRLGTPVLTLCLMKQLLLNTLLCGLFVQSTARDDILCRVYLPHSQIPSAVHAFHSQTIFPKKNHHSEYRFGLTVIKCMQYIMANYSLVYTALTLLLSSSDHGSRLVDTWAPASPPL